MISYQKIPGFLGLTLVIACSPRPEPQRAATLQTAPSASTPAPTPAATPTPPAHRGAAPPPSPPTDDRITLSHWWLHTSAKLGVDGKYLSTPGAQTKDWFPATVPTTVLAALVAAGKYPDPFIGNNLAQIPAVDFASSYWYRTELTLPPSYAGREVWLIFDGINYRANIWLNGELLASAKEIVGTFPSHEFNVTRRVRPGQPNALAVEIFAPDLKHDLALTWLDWNPGPPDRDMGIWRNVSFEPSGAVTARATRVLSKVDLATLDHADLTVKSELSNRADHAVNVDVEAKITPEGDASAPPVVVQRTLSLAAGEAKTIAFEPSQFPELALAHPRLWWPRQMGAPNLYRLALRITTEGRESDSASVTFGVRAVSFELEPNGARLFRINGKKLFVRGGGWASDMLLRSSQTRLDTEFSLFQDLNLNTIRLEGKLETNEFYDKADREGILVTPGWMCCDRWQASAKWTPAEHQIAIASMASEARRLVNHPSVIDFLIGSDEAPAPKAERELVEELRKVDWQAAITPAASARTAALLGKSGVKMTGPYDWVAPVYWYEDHKYGGAYGYNTETSPGPAVPELESLRAWLDPKELEALWRKPDAKLFHAGTRGTRFDNLGVFNRALAARFGKPASLEEYVLRAQLMNYEAQRAMYEAYGRNKYQGATGISQWLLNNAWPSLIWHLYGYDFSTAGGYFGSKKANEPLHAQYSYDDRSIVVVNHSAEAASELVLGVSAFDTDSKERYHAEVPVTAAADAVVKAAVLPALVDAGAAYFVRLTLRKGSVELSQNWYWLSQKPEVSAYALTDWDYTPVKQFADLGALAHLARADLVATLASADGKERRTLRVSLENKGKTLAFFVRLKLERGERGAQVLPAFWQDNYISLLPGERREVSVSYQDRDLAGAEPQVVVSGLNVEPFAATHPTAARIEPNLRSK